MNHDDGEDIIDKYNFMIIGQPQKVYIGVDWAEDSGMNRGDIVKREENVIHVRFKTVTF